MSSSKNETKKTAEEQMEAGSAAAEKTKKSGKKQEPVYSAEEFCSSAQALFHTKPECVRAALKERNITQCSRAEAEQIVRNFMKKEVK